MILFFFVFFSLMLSLELCYAPLIISCPADHVPDWQHRILLGKVAARSVSNMNNTHTRASDFRTDCIRHATTARTRISDRPFSLFHQEMAKGGGLLQVVSCQDRDGVSIIRPMGKLVKMRQRFYLTDADGHLVP